MNPSSRQSPLQEHTHSLPGLPPPQLESTTRLKIPPRIIPLNLPLFLKSRTICYPLSLPSQQMAQAEALRALGATPEPVGVLSFPTLLGTATPIGKKRGRPFGSKNKPKPSKGVGEATHPTSESDVPEEPKPKAKRGRPLGSKNKVCRWSHAHC